MLKGILEWFKPNVKMKRWICLMLLGVGLACYGFSKVITLQELDIMSVIQIVAFLGTGFIAIVVGFIFTQKRVLEILVESSTQLSKNSKKSNLGSLIFNKKVFDKGPKIVVIGGGTGLSTILKGLKFYTSNITAVVAVSESEESSNFNATLEALTPKEITDCIVALSSDEMQTRKLLEYSFSDNEGGINVGNILLKAMENMNGNFAAGVQKLNKVLNLTGKLLPVTLDNITVMAELEDGTVVEGANNISKIGAHRISKIKRTYIRPTNARPAEGVIDAIKDADAVILGPGSLYSSVIPCLMVREVAKAVREHDGIKVYVCNVMTEEGQTENYAVSDHIKALQEHAGRDIIDFCLSDGGEITPEFIRMYNKKGQDMVISDPEEVRKLGVLLLQRQMANVEGEYIRHNPEKLALGIMEMVCEDLKYKNKGAKLEYVLANQKLKSVRGKNIKDKNKVVRSSIKGKHAKPKSKASINFKDDEKDKNTRYVSEKMLNKKSKFNEKYEERIKSIKDSRQKREVVEKKEKEQFISQIVSGIKYEDE